MNTHIGTRWLYLGAGVLGLALGIAGTHVWYSPLLADTTSTLRTVGEKLDASEDRYQACSANLAAAGKASQDLSAIMTERVRQAEQALASAQEDLDRAKDRTEMAERWAHQLSRREASASSASLCDKLDALLTDTIENRRGQ
ncbi:hypothetical protein [Cupriavidus necator]